VESSCAANNKVPKLLLWYSAHTLQYITENLTFRHYINCIAFVAVASSILLTSHGFLVLANLIRPIKLLLSRSVICPALEAMYTGYLPNLRCWNEKKHSTVYCRGAWLFMCNMCCCHSVKIIESKDILVTSSEDCSVRLWTTVGHYIGKI